MAIRHASEMEQVFIIFNLSTCDFLEIAIKMKKGIKQLVASDESLGTYTIDSLGWQRIETTYQFLQVTFMINL